MLKRNLSNASAPHVLMFINRNRILDRETCLTSLFKDLDNSDLKLAKQQAERSSAWMNDLLGLKNLLRSVSAQKNLLMLLPVCAVLDKHIYPPHTAQHYVFSW